MPAHPKPDTARPRISTAETGATPPSKDPISKMPIDVRNTYFTENWRYSLPNRNWNAQEVRRLGNNDQSKMRKRDK